jgi:hypothetical protein
VGGAGLQGAWEGRHGVACVVRGDGGLDGGAVAGGRGGAAAWLNSAGRGRQRHLYIYLIISIVDAARAVHALSAPPCCRPECSGRWCCAPSQRKLAACLLERRAACVHPLLCLATLPSSCHSTGSRVSSLPCPCRRCSDCGPPRRPPPCTAPALSATPWPASSPKGMAAGAAKMQHAAWHGPARR